MKETQIGTFTELHKLIKYGFDRFSLFPSLDSLAAHIEWLQSREY
jgi:hypothetical protein